MGCPDPVRQLLRSEIVPSRHICDHRTWCNSFGNNPSFLLVAPSPAADHARYFRVAPNDLRVFTNVDHNVHTIHDPKNHDRALIAFTQLCGVRAPLTENRLNSSNNLGLAGSISPLQKHAEFLLGLIERQPYLTLDELAMRKTMLGEDNSTRWRELLVATRLTLVSPHQSPT